MKDNRQVGQQAAADPGGSAESQKHLLISYVCADVERLKLLWSHAPGVPCPRSGNMINSVSPEFTQGALPSQRTPRCGPTLPKHIDKDGSFCEVMQFQL